MYVIIFGQFCVLGPVYMEGQPRPRPQGAFPKPRKRPGDEDDGGGYPR